MGDHDFGGYATKANIKCRDGRVIKPEAFQHMDGKRVPLVWQHGHDKSDNVLGHAILKATKDGVYAYGYFNKTTQGENARQLVQHGDVEALSIYANQLVEKNVGDTKSVLHGQIKEVSLVLAGANPGAKIDFVRVAHGDGDIETLHDEAVIYTGLKLSHGDHDEEPIEGDNKIEHSTVKEVYDSMTTEQQDLLNYMVAKAMEHSDTDPHGDEPEDPEPEDDAGDDEDDLEHKEEGTDVTKRNVFEQNKSDDDKSQERHILSHEDVKGIFAAATRTGSMKAAVEEYALQHGITDIDLLFPDAKLVPDRPELDKRRTEWVAAIINGVRRSPFSRVKTLVADITHEDARAKGYITGEFKKEEWISLSKRTTSPTTVYKKQKLDRDDILDITDFDIVAWLKAEMRLMLEEEVARAILLGDGRASDDDDKVKDPVGAQDGVGIRSIANDHELFAATVNVNIDDANSNYNEVITAVIRARRFYKGSGNPTFYTTEQTISEFLLLTDTTGRRLYPTLQELATALRVSSLVAVEPMEEEAYADIVGIIVNVADYNVGTDRGGEINFFDDFDIDYNQYKYLTETRASGALVKIRSALVIRKVASGDVLVDPITIPTFVASTGVVTIPTQTGVVYKNDVTDATLSAGAQSALSAGATLKVRAEPASGYYFATNRQDQWSFTRPAA